MLPRQPPSVLLLATDEQLCYLIERYADQSGCAFAALAATEPALALLQSERPALILLYLMGWPGDGWQILQQLRASLAAQPTPVVVISGLADEARARAEGADYWLWQPVMYQDFVDMLAATGVLGSFA